jgi:hypothetical protein
MELGGLEPPTSWVRSRPEHRSPSVMSCRLALGLGVRLGQQAAARRPVPQLLDSVRAAARRSASVFSVGPAALVVKVPPPQPRGGKDTGRSKFGRRVSAIGSRAVSPVTIQVPGGEELVAGSILQALDMLADPRVIHATLRP